MRCLAFLLLLCACPSSAPEPTPRAPLGPRSVWGDEVGGPIRGLDDDQLAAFGRGRALMERVFKPSEGLGPTYNADGCVSCHEVPALGGTAGRQRDVFLAQRTDGDQREDLGTDPGGPLRKLFSTEEGHTPEPPGATSYARRSPTPFFGVGLFTFVDVDAVLAREDPEDADGDGISGRAHRVDGQLGRFGYKAQAATVEDAVRAALREQMGVTSPEVGWTPKELAAAQSPALGRADGWSLVPRAHAHPHNPREAPGLDDDGVADPELQAGDLADLVAFVTYLAPVPPGPSDERTEAGRAIFEEIGCADCHVPSLPSAFGDLPAYTDLLLHDMGDELGEDVPIGNASAREFRTTPLWGLRTHVPYMHDGDSPAYHFTRFGHGGEAAAAAAAYEALSPEDELALTLFLDSLGGQTTKGRFLVPPGTGVPPVGSLGGPDEELDPWEVQLWQTGRSKFDRRAAPSFNSGLGLHFNADSCSACHRQPAVGGAGTLDDNVLVFHGGVGFGPEAGESPLAEGTLPRAVITRYWPFRLPDGATLVESRQSPSLLGVGLLDRLPDAAILAHHDPDDADGDGISGRARVLFDGRIGRFGWKARIPTVFDFTFDALRAEMGITTPTHYSAYTHADADWKADPELSDAAPLEMAFYSAHLAPPRAGDPEAHPEGREVFERFGCGDCHLADLGGVAAYTDLLLHDVGGDRPLHNGDPEVLPGEFRTPPLWGISLSPPYLHDGRAEDLTAAVIEGHFGEADAARRAFEEGSEAEREALLGFLGAL